LAVYQRLKNKKRNFTGNEQILIPNLSLQNIITYKQPKTKSISEGTPLIHSSMEPYFGFGDGYIPIRIGSIHTHEHLYTQGIHTNQTASLVSENNIAISLIFGKCDIFEPCVRLWDSNNNSHYEKSMHRAGFYSSCIRVFINLNTCFHMVDIDETKILGKIHWNLSQTQPVQKKNFGKSHLLYVGMMFVISYVYKDSHVFFQLGEDPVYESWREQLFGEFVDD